MDGKQQIQQYLLGNLDDAGVQALNEALEADPDLRREFRFAVRVDSALREEAVERTIDESRLAQPSSDPPQRWASSWKIVVACLAVAASMALIVRPQFLVPETVATLASSEDAAWESDLPTSPGSALAAGTLNLKAGLATIQFRSGAELVLEAPAELELVSSMRARLTVGAAVMNVPDSAVGFTLETPDGYAIDFGTRFAVRVDGDTRTAGFELIEGEIEVHHPATGDSIRLNEAGTAAEVTGESMLLVQQEETSETEQAPTPEPTKLIRIGTEGRCGTAMPRSHKRHKFIDPELLSVKKSATGKWDFRSFFEFDLSAVNRDRIDNARLRLNLVPSTRGVASRLPKINRFAVYGMTNAAKQNWNTEPTWEESPAPEDGVLLGKFEIERSRQRGTFGISSEALLEFIKQRGDRPVTLILVRETSQIEGAGVSLTHMFASDKHPESVGPLLELTLR